MNPLYNHYIIDLSSNNNFVQNPTMQGDGNNVRGIEIELIANGIQYVVDTENTIVSIMGTKPDTKQVCNECEVTDEGYILVDITSQMSAVKGRGDYCIVLMDKNTNSQLKSFPFYILTTSAPFNISEIVSSDEFQLLTSSIVETKKVTEEAREEIANMQELEAEVASNELTRQNNETQRIANEQVREDEFDAFMVTANAEVARLQQENDKASASALLAEQYKDSAQASADTATTQATNASTSATNAKASEDNAKISETNAKTSEDNAKVSETNAENFANNAKASEDLSSQYATQVKDSADIVVSKVDEAVNAADSILGVEDEIMTKATEALNYLNQTKSYAVGTNNEIRENDSVDNAKYYYEQAKGISEGLNGALLPMGTIAFEDLENQTKQSGYMYNISNSFVTTATFKEGEGYNYPSGTNVYYTADGYWDCFAGTMVTSINGMKGDVVLSTLGEIVSSKDEEPTDQEPGEYWLFEY